MRIHPAERSPLKQGLCRLLQLLSITAAVGSVCSDREREEVGRGGRITCRAEIRSLLTSVGEIMYVLGWTAQSWKSTESLAQMLPGFFIKITKKNTRNKMCFCVI